MAKKQRWNNETKNNMRDLALQFSGTSSAALVFPGENLFCVKQGLDSGLFDTTDTTLICIERDPKIALHIEKNLKRLGCKKFYLHNNDASDLTKRIMSEVLGSKKIDFAFLDFCNTINQETAIWLARECRSVFANNAKVSFTFALRTLNERHRYLERIDTDRIYPCLQICPSVIDYDRKFGTYRDNPRTTLVGLWLAMAINYTFDIKGINGYNTTGNPMLLVRTKILNDKPVIENKYFWNLTHDNQTIHSCFPNSRKVSEQIGCHPVMPKDLQNHFVRQAKLGVRPPWINPAEWAWHSVNPSGQSSRRKAV
jgi:hypothetical protein